MYTQYTIFIIKKVITQIILNLQTLDIFPWGLKNELETAVVNKPSVFEPLKFCFIKIFHSLLLVSCESYTIMYPKNIAIEPYF